MTAVTPDTRGGLVEVATPRARTRRDRPAFSTLISAGGIGFIALLAIIGPMVTPHEPAAQHLDSSLIGPSAQFWLGTDDLGRDVFSRVIVGARTALLGPLVVALGAAAIGNTLGLLAGYRGGWTDTMIMRWVDLMLSLPSLLVAIVVVGILGGEYGLAVAVLILLFSPYDTRLVRGAALEQRAVPYVEAARSLGVGPTRIMAVHIWPNVLPIVVANTFLNFAFALVGLSSLSFLGLGVPPGSADWGRMLAENQTLVFDNPAAALAPAAMIIITAALMNLLGDRVYEGLSDRGARP